MVSILVLPCRGMKRDLGLWFKLFLFRFLVALCTLSAGHPDELWQFHEPAHSVVFNRGHLTWDWRARIRSFVFPLPMIATFYMAKLVGQAGFKGSEDFIVQMAPIVIRAFWASTSDLYTVKLARRFFGPLSAKWALLFTLSSRAQAHMGTRAYSNAVESALCAIVAYIWPTNQREWTRRKWIATLAVLGLTCLVRISAVQMFLPAALLVFFYAPRPLEVILVALPLITLIVSLGIAIDSFFYGQLTVSWWNFFQWNVLQNVSSFFGTSPFYFYFASLGNELLRTALPFTLFGLSSALFTRKSLFPLLAFVLPYFIFSSIQPHKEDRFILPILPLLLVYSAHGGQQLEVWLTKKHRYLKYFAKLILMAMVAYNSWDITRELCLKFIAPWNAIQDLRNRIKTLTPVNSSDGIFLLANCHNFPHYGVFHYDYPLTFISCPPHFYQESFKSDHDYEMQYKLGYYQYLDQHDEALEYFMNNSDKPPRYVAIFGHTYLGKAEAIRSLGYKECGRHVSFILDQLQGKDTTLNDVFILCYSQ